MNYATDEENGIKCPIEYVCLDCDFRTFEQSEEQEHYSRGHYLKSEIRSDMETKL